MESITRINMSIFDVEYMENGEWKPAVYTPQEINGAIYTGIYFNDDFIVSDYSTIYPFYTWINIRIKCNLDVERINLWAARHNNPDLTDLNGIKMQNGDEDSTYATYKIVNSMFRDSNRFYFWIKATNQSADYIDISNNIFDDKMSEFATTKNHDIIVPTSEYRVINDNYLGWYPRNNPLASGIDQTNVFKVTSESPKNDVARWIMSWDNTCVNANTNLKNPLIPNTTAASICDVFGKIVGQNGKAWLHCLKDNYIYGKILYCLEDHDFENHKMFLTDGKKSCGIEIFGVYYG